MAKALLIAAVMIGALVGGVTLFITDLPPWKTALLIIGFALVVILTMGACLAFFARTLDARFGPRAQPGDVIEGDYRPLQIQGYKPPMQIAPPARVVNVPRFTTNGVVRPMVQAVQLETVCENGDSLAVPLPALMRFLSLATPSRSEWTGARNIYGDCFEFCIEHGLIERRQNGGGKWRAEYPLSARREWVLQFDEHAQARAQ